MQPRAEAKPPSGAPHTGALERLWAGHRALRAAQAQGLAVREAARRVGLREALVAQIWSGGPAQEKGAGGPAKRAAASPSPALLGRRS